MTIKKSIFALLTIGLLGACGEDALTNQIDFSTPYAIQDDPNDPIQHHCYEIYQKYGVSVYFNDTIQTTLEGTDHKGKPVYKYETLDLNWDFTSHDGKTVTYEYDYLTKQEDKEKAMRFVDSYLNRVSKSMRPFTIFLADTIRKVTSKETTKYVTISTFRVLGMAQLTKYSDEQIDSLSQAIVNNSVLSKVQLNAQVCARFWEISGKSNWYGLYWAADATGENLGITSEYFTGGYKSIKLAPNVIWDDEAYENSCTQNPNSPLNPSKGWTEETFNEVRAEIINAIGQFGFICGTDYPLSHLKAPSQSEDLKFFINAMLELTEAEFKARYGESASVMKKYNILKEYITNTLQVELK